MSSIDGWHHINLLLNNDIKSFDKKPEAVYKILDPVIKACADDLKQDNLRRGRECRYLRSTIFGLKTDLDEVKTTLRGKSTKLSDGSALRFILEEFEMKLTTAKAETKSNAFNIDAQLEVASRELLEASRDIDTWLRDEEAQQATSTLKEKQKKLYSEEHLRKDLEHKQRLGFIEKQIFSLGGPHGGWHFQDNDVFLRVWVQTQSPASVKSVPLSAGDAIRKETVAIVGLPISSTMRNEEEEEDDGTAVATVAGSVTTIATNTMIDIGNLNKTDVDSESDISAMHNENESPLSFQFVLSSVQKPKIIRKLTPLLSHKTAEMVDEHIEWYLRFLALTHAKKALIQQWKLSKFGNNESESNEDSHGQDQYSGSFIDSIFCSDSKIVSERSEEERKHMKQQVAQWKQSREAETQQRRQIEDLVRQQKERDELERKKKRQMELKVQVDLWKEVQDKEEKELKEMEKLLEQPSSKALKPEELELELRKRQDRDLAIAEKRKFILSKVYEDQHKSKADRLQEMYANENMGEVLFPQVKRDPQRLVNGTKASRMAQLTSQDLEENEIRRQTASAHTAKIALSARDLKFTGRATPAWMKPGMR